MSEPNTTTTGDAVELSVVDDMEDTVEVEVEIPDEDVDAFIASIRYKDEGAKTVRAKDAREMLAAHKLTEDGAVWVDVTCFEQPGEVQLGDMQAAGRKQVRVERTWRRQNPKFNKAKKGGAPVDLPDGVDEELWVLATFGTAITNWRGPAFGGMEFTIENYCGEAGLMRVPTFKREILDHVGDPGGAAIEVLRKNS